MSLENQHLSMHNTAKIYPKLAGVILLLQLVFLPAAHSVEVLSDETFAERAMRTRMPGRVDRSRAEKLAGFCLGDPLPLREVVDIVVADLAADLETTAKDEPAMEVVYKSLMKNYPCKQ